MRTKRLLTLLEVLITASMLAVGGGLVFWKLDRFVQTKRLHADADKIKSVLLHARTLALNARADFQVELSRAKNHWNLRIQNREDPTAQPVKWPGSLSSCNVSFNDVSTKKLTFDFFSSGHVLPEGTLSLQTDTQKVLISLSELFKQSSEQSSL